MIAVRITRRVAVELAEPPAWWHNLMQPRKVAAGLRWAWLRLTHPRLRVGLFYLGAGAELEIGPAAELDFGRRVRFLRDFTGSWLGQVHIGDGVFFNRGCYVSVYSSLTIGRNCLFGERVSIHDENHVFGRGDEPIERRGFTARPIVIGENVWVGANAVILPGVRIGDNAVIGAHAVVTHDVPACSVAVGIPARVVRDL